MAKKGYTFDDVEWYPLDAVQHEILRKGHDGSIGHAYQVVTSLRAQLAEIGGNPDNVNHTTTARKVQAMAAAGLIKHIEFPDAPEHRKPYTNTPFGDQTYEQDFARIERLLESNPPIFQE